MFTIKVRDRNNGASLHVTVTDGRVVRESILPWAGSYRHGAAAAVMNFQGPRSAIILSNIYRQLVLTHESYNERVYEMRRTPR